MTTPLSAPPTSLLSQALSQMGEIVKQLAGELRKIATAVKTLSEWSIPDLVPTSLKDKEFEIAPIPDDLSEDNPDKLAQRVARKKGLKKN